MKILSLTQSHREEILSQAERILRSGGVVVVPTDTVYGFISNATNTGAVQKIFEIKKRAYKKPLLIFVKDVPMARRYAYISDIKVKFLERVWPGAITVVFHHKEKLPRVLTAEKDSIGIRIPNHEFVQTLLTRCDFPLAQTSANISEEMPLPSVVEIEKQFKKAEVTPDLIIDGGAILGKASTILDYTGDGLSIIRMGAMTKRDFDKLLSVME